MSLSMIKYTAHLVSLNKLKDKEIEWLHANFIHKNNEQVSFLQDITWPIYLYK
jgi:hypothetical protein